MHAPRTTHLDVVNKIIRYLKGSPGQGIWMKKNNTNKILAYSDADWAGKIKTCKSTSGSVFLVNGCSVSWASKHQDLVTLSSTKAEYMAATQAFVSLTIMLYHSGVHHQHQGPTHLLWMTGPAWVTNDGPTNKFAVRP